jgi:hypothetical protein
MSKSQNRQKISALQARRAADRAVFGELVGCALSSGDPIWSPGPEPCWRVPYRLLDGTLLTEVQVNAHTQAVLLTEQEREALLEQVELAVTTGNVSTWSSCGQMAAKHCPTVLTGHSSIDLAKDERVAGMEAL